MEAQPGLLPSERSLAGVIFPTLDLALAFQAALLAAAEAGRSAVSVSLGFCPEDSVCFLTARCSHPVLWALPGRLVQALGAWAGSVLRAVLPTRLMPSWP